MVLPLAPLLSEQQTSAALGIAPGTVKSRLSRAFAPLAENPHRARRRTQPMTEKPPATLDRLWAETTALGLELLLSTVGIETPQGVQMSTVPYR